MPEVLPVIASIVGIGSGVKNLAGGSQQGGSRSSSTYVPTGLGSADQLFQQLLQGGAGASQQAAGQINPVLQQAFARMLGIDPSGLLQGAGQAGNLYQGQINPALNAQNSLFGNAGNIAGAGNQLYQTAFDPQNALRDRLQQQVTDASRASTSARGISMGGEAAGIENQDVSRFLQDWQNQQLQRQYMGLQGLSGAYDQAGRNYAGGLAAGGLAPGYAQQSGAVPYGAQLTAAQQPFNAANQYSSALGGVNSNIAPWLSQIIPYLNQGLGATGQSFNQGQQNLGNIFQGAYNLGGEGGATPLTALSKIFQSGPNYNSGGGGWTSGYDLPFGG